MKRSAVTAVGLAVAFALTGCSQSAFTDESGKTQKPGVYQYEQDGGTMTLEVPAAPGDYAATAELESLRKDAKAEEVTYILGDADNSQGSRALSPSSIHLYNDSGKEYDFYAAAGYLAENWDPSQAGDQDYRYPDGSPMDEEKYYALATKVDELYKSHLHRGAPGSRSTQVWIHKGADIPDQFTDLSVVKTEGKGDDGAIRPTRGPATPLPDDVKRAK